MPVSVWSLVKKESVWNKDGVCFGCCTPDAATSQFKTVCLVGRDISKERVRDSSRQRESERVFITSYW